MAYENLELIVAVMSGEIYLAKAKNNVMDTSARRLMTDDVLRSATEWFAKNKKKAIGFSGIDDSSHYLFYTQDRNKQERIMKILKEGNE